MRRHLLAVLTSVAAVATLGCAPAVDAQEPGSVSTALRVDRELASGLTSPWGLAFLPDGSALVSERDTALIRRIPADGGRAVTVGRVSGVVPGGEGGLLGLVVPAGPEPDHVLAYLTSARDNRVVRIAWDGQALGAQRPILTGIPRNTFHNGGRLLLDRDGMLFVATGDAGSPDLAQDRRSLAGKILRITPDGRPAPGNPFRGSPVYSLGHRNVQGLALDARGRLWASEFGDKDVDELNLIRPGGNYGWPVHEGAAGDERYVDPRVEWSPTSIASPSGIAIRNGVAFVASLRGEALWRIALSGTGAGSPRRVDLGDLGRLRTIAVAPDGALWLMTSNTDGRAVPGSGDDRVLRLVARR